MALHEIKIWPEPYAALERGEKKHEVRRTDRNYKVGDVLALREWTPSGFSRDDGEPLGEYTGRMRMMRVTYITKPGTFGLPADVCVMSLAVHRGRRAP
jgi:hypothetical protein